MTPDPRLNFLATLREAVGLSQAEVAQRFGFAGRQSYKSVAAWEKGASAPKARLRARFLRYLWDVLRLYKEPTCFADYWAMLVECWHWEPLSADERGSLRLPPPPLQEREPDTPPLPSIIVNGAHIGGNVTTGGPVASTVACAALTSKPQISVDRRGQCHARWLHGKTHPSAVAGRVLRSLWFCEARQAEMAACAGSSSGRAACMALTSRRQGIVNGRGQCHARYPGVHTIMATAFRI